MNDLLAARNEAQTAEHEVIAEAIRDQGEGYTVFSVPIGVLYRPSEEKIKNMEKRDYIPRPKLVANSDAKDNHTGFSGPVVRVFQFPVYANERKHRRNV
jgi:hypothetical protein